MTKKAIIKINVNLPAEARKALVERIYKEWKESGHYKIFLIPKECQDYKNFCPNCGARLKVRGGAE